MSAHLKAFIKAEFSSFIKAYLENEQHGLRSVEEPFMEHVTEAFNEYIQNEMSVRHLLASHLAQDDAMNDKDHLTDRLTYWENQEGDESIEECIQQINGIKMLISGCS